MLNFLDSEVVEYAIGAIHQAIATLRRTYANPTPHERPIYEALLKAIEIAAGASLSEIPYDAVQRYINELATKQRELSKRIVQVDGDVGQRLLDTLRKEHGTH